MAIRTCVRCGNEFNNIVRIDGVEHHLHSRSRCLDCFPYIKPKKYAYKKFTGYEKGFLEGAIDSDGCISLYNPRQPSNQTGGSPKIRLIISNNNIDFLKKCREIVGGGGCFVKKDDGIHALQYEYRMCHIQAKHVLSQINLIVKKDRQILALQIIDKLTNRERKGLGTSDKHKAELNRLLEKWK